MIAIDVHSDYRTYLEELIPGAVSASGGSARYYTGDVTGADKGKTEADSSLRSE
jgi:hypothetical protein